MKTIYSGYYDRLFEIGKKNKCIFMEHLPKKDFFDLSKIKGTADFLAQKIDSLPFDFSIDPTQKYYVGYPYLTCKKKDAEIKAPLLFYPIKQEDGSIYFDGSPVLNRALFLLFEGKKRRNNLFLRLSEQNNFTPEALLADMKECGYVFTVKKNSRLTTFPNAIPTKNPAVYPIAVLGKFGVLSPMQEDYCLMQKRNLKNNAVEELLGEKTINDKSKKESARFTEETDYSQEQAVRKSQRNIVLYGPPGTGKSQTIAAIVGNETCQSKNTLVVSQKKVALEVIAERLRWFEGGILLLTDEEDKEEFFRSLAKAHAYVVRQRDNDSSELNKVEEEIKEITEMIECADRTLHRVTPYGSSLQKMYETALRYSDNKRDNQLLDYFLSTDLTLCGQEELSNAISTIKNGLLMEKFIEYHAILTDNPLAVYTNDVTIETLDEVKRSLAQKYRPFPYEKYGCARYILPYLIDGIENKKQLASVLLNIKNRKLVRFYHLSHFPLCWLFYPILRTKYRAEKNKLLSDINECEKEYKNFIAPLLPLKKFIDKEGFHYVVEGLANGATDRLKIVGKTIDNYLRIRELKTLFSDISPVVKSILSFCYDHSENNLEEMDEILRKIIPIRICHELKSLEPTVEKKLLSMGKLEEMRQRLHTLKAQRTVLTREYAIDKNNKKFRDYAKKHPEKYKNFVFRINNPGWTVKKMITVFYDFIIRLYPCILASPAAASTFPLKKNLFDKVVFDEASQLPVENAIPALYRGKTVVIAGDDKQLPPSGTFSKKIEEKCEEDELSKQDAMDAKSLLDLASVKFVSLPLLYHYRSRFSQLIDFSNAVYYDNKLCVAPNASFLKEPPIEWIKVRGKKIDRKNKREANMVINLIEKNIDKGSIGVITFNIEQMTLIKELLDKKTAKNPEWKNKWNGFVKNIENIQGEETDIVIFSTCFAPDENNKLYARYGSLAVEGGEKRLNVAITRAKKKIFVVTSIEPTELPVDSVKNLGPKILKDYLLYAKAVSMENTSLNQTPSFSVFSTPRTFEQQLKERLEQIGYSISVAVKSTGYQLSMAIWDERDKRFLLGIECDTHSYEAGGTAQERDISRPSFLEQKGWNILRVWARDWWLSPQKVITKICDTAEMMRRKRSLRLDLAAPLPASGETEKNIALEIGK